MAGQSVPLTEADLLNIVYRLGVRTLPTETSKQIFVDRRDEGSVDDGGLLQEWIDHFMQKQQDYGDTADDLGVPGQYAELHRKLGKLRRSMWEGIPMRGEQPDEILLDLIGHCFLAIRTYRADNYGRKLTR